MAPRRRRPPVGPGLEEVIVIALASARVARAISVDEITEPMRVRLNEVVGVGDQDCRRGRQLLVGLVNCPVCVGWWASFVLSALWPGRHRLRRGLSVAGFQVLITMAERLLSEQGRLAVRQIEEEEADGRNRVTAVAGR